MAEFDPDAYLAKNAPKAFDPDAYLAKIRPAAAQPDAAPPQDPTEQMFVSREAATDTRPVGEKWGHVGKYYGEMVPMAADSATFGLGNRGVAYGRSILDQSKAETYGKHIASQNEYLKQLRDADPGRAFASDLLGGVAFGGASGAGLAAAGLLRPGANWAARAGRGFLGGTTQSSAQAAGQSYTDDWKDKVGAAINPWNLMGGVFGAAVPLATSTARGIKALRDARRGIPEEHPAALLRSVETNRAGIEKLDELGPDAMLVDAGTSMRRLGQAAATTEGPGVEKLIGTLAARDVETPVRLHKGLEQKFGPDVNKTEVRQGVKDELKQEGPQWDAAFANAKPVDPTRVAAWADLQVHGEVDAAKTAMERVRKALNIHDSDALDPDPRKLHKVRRMIDGMLDDEKNGDVIRALKGARERISEELHTKVPGMAVLDAAWKEKASRLDAFERGQEILDTGRSNYIGSKEWQAEKNAMALPKNNPRSVMWGPSEAPKYSELGTRAELGRLVEAGSNDLQTLRTNIAPYSAAAEKLAIQFGAKNVEDVQTLLKTNQAFREAYQKIAHGSKTAETLGLDATLDKFRPIPQSWIGGGLELLNRGLTKAGAQGGVAARNRIAELLATRGPELDDLRKQLLNAASDQKRQDLIRTLTERMIRSGGGAVIPEPLRITVHPKR